MNYKFKTKPYEHQLKALEMSWERPYFAYFMEMGTGKSKVLIDNISMLYDNGKINGVLIVAPKGVVKNWHEGEIPTHLVDHIEHKNILWQSLINIKQQKKLDSLFETGEDLHILVMNVESLSTKKGVAFAEKFLNSHRALMAIDESTTIKNPEAKRTKNIVTLGKLATYRRILTGSPVTKSPLDLFKQCEYLDPELLGFSSFYTFRNRYAVMVDRNFGGRRVQIPAGYRRLDELSEILKKFSDRVLKQDCLDLPEKTFTKRTVELSEEQKKAYDEMKSSAITILKGQSSTAVNVLTQLIRLHQITCGHMKTDSGEVINLKSSRLDELMQILAENTGKVIIWANYIHDILNIEKAIKEEYGSTSYCTYYGATKAEDRQRCIYDFQNKKNDCRFFIGNTQTGGYGITLTAASTVVYYSNNYDLEKRIQSEDRAHRIGQKNPVLYIDLVAKKTVDEKIIQALRNKVNIAKEISGEELSKWI